MRGRGRTLGAGTETAMLNILFLNSSLESSGRLGIPEAQFLSNLSMVLKYSKHGHEQIFLTTKLLSTKQKCELNFYSRRGVRGELQRSDVSGEAQAA